MIHDPLMSKSALMALVARGHANECFEHADAGRFDVTAMRKAAPFLGELICVSLTDIVPHIRSERVTEDARVRELGPISWQDDPGLAVYGHFGKSDVVEHLIIDGHHRALRRMREGLKDMMIWQIPIERALRPNDALFAKRPGYDWGDELRDGKIFRRT